ncbi:hypothetical protein [Saccharobesus litoralis]|uniref:hypothetical protein n=1 Tax=Saccharobesus litoralis TaxID=2172099 RepID=UPI00131F2405|nr:hypothetical protein [Saccharobesus litoralis]
MKPNKTAACVGLRKLSANLRQLKLTALTFMLAEPASHLGGWSTAKAKLNALA